MTIPSDPQLVHQPESGLNTFARRVSAVFGGPLRGATLRTVQVNIGLRCNLACRHCHVESSPKRREEMSWDTMLMVLDAARRASAETIDITGGAPEMHPHFRRFVDAARAQGQHVIVRTNLTIALEPGYEDLPEYFAARQVALVASLPCYLESNVDKQRGRHVYKESIEVIQRLNRVGYGIDPQLHLDLVYNPGAAVLPPPQEQLENAYRTELLQRFGIRFNHLYTITNMPIGRFQSDLARNGQAERYQQLLEDSFNPRTIGALMCRHQLHVGWDGQLYDCDFNYALALPALGRIRHLRDFEPEQFLRRAISTKAHCFGCTAGCGSSCSGSLLEANEPGATAR
ncbi:MAG: arsenosugar biosynthesis radical SAM (seleno)protein ArsS [Planctomycetota bacterium]